MFNIVNLEEFETRLNLHELKLFLEKFNFHRIREHDSYLNSDNNVVVLVNLIYKNCYSLIIKSEAIIGTSKEFSLIKRNYLIVVSKDNNDIALQIKKYLNLASFA